MSRNTAPLFLGNTKNIAGVNKVGIGNMPVGSDKAIQTDLETLGYKKHCITGNYRVTPLKIMRASMGNARHQKAPPFFSKYEKDRKKRFGVQLFPRLILYIICTRKKWVNNLPPKPQVLRPFNPSKPNIFFMNQK